MEAFDYECLQLPETQPPKLKATKKQHCPTAHNDILRLHQHKNTTKFISTNQYKITKKSLPTARMPTMQATSEDILNHYLGNNTSDLLRVTIARKEIKLETLKEIFDAVRPNTIDQADIYLQLVEELKKIKTIPTNQIVFFVEFFQKEIQNKLTQRIINQEDDQNLEDTVKQTPEKTIRVNLPQSDGLLDCLTGQSIFQQGQTIELLKKKFRNSVFSQTQKKLQISQEEIQGNTTTKTLQNKSLSDSFDQTQAQEFLQQRERNGQNVAVLRQIMVWHKDLMRILKAK